MKKIIKKILAKEYDPRAYWNARSNPNNTEGESQERVDFDIGYIKKAIDGCESIMELGPGVGRTFGVYNAGSCVTTIDLSHKYAEKLSLIGKDNGLTLNQFYLDKVDSPFPFDDKEFSVGVASQVLLHIPPEYIRHSLSELVRVCEKVVIITAYTHGLSTNEADHVFNHDYFSLSTDLGCVMNDLIMNEGRICFTVSKS